MAEYLDIENWNRREHYHFFSAFDEPFFGVTTEVEVTRLYHEAKQHQHSFFLKYLHASLVAVNDIKSFRYRITEDKKVIIHERIDASPTIIRPDGTFGFSYIKYSRDFNNFQQEANKEIERVKQIQGLGTPSKRSNVIHYSALPWIHFTSVSHARSFSVPDGVPKISFGKMINKGHKKVMPVSVHAHHGLMDGYDVGKFFSSFQKMILNPNT